MYYGYKKHSLDFSVITLNSNNVIEPNLTLYEELLKIQSPSKHEGDMNKYIIKYIRTRFNNVLVEQDQIGNLYVTKGDLEEGESFPCLVAHTDEVHGLDPDRMILKAGDFYIGWNNRTGEREGIGADDKNGIFIALTLLDYFDVIKLFFPVQEEVGLVGTSNCDLSWFNDVGYLMQCDRRGCKDFISTTNGVEVTSIDFLIHNEDILTNYNYNEAIGTCTDIGGLAKQGVGVSACNISCGYWEEHSDEEFTHIPSLINCLNMVYFILINSKLNKFEHEVPENKYNSYDDYSSYSDWYDDIPSIPNASVKDVDLDNMPDNVESYPCLHCRDQDCINCTKWDR